MTVRANINIYTCESCREAIDGRKPSSRIREGIASAVCSVRESVASACDWFMDLPEVRSLREGSLEGMPAEELSTSSKVLGVVSLVGSTALLSIIMAIF